MAINKKAGTISHTSFPPDGFFNVFILDENYMFILSLLLINIGEQALIATNIYNFRKIIKYKIYKSYKTYKSYT